MKFKMEDLKNLSVLYADDDDVLRETTAKTLKLIVGEVYTASDGAEALGIYNEHMVHIILLDIRMGMISGIEVAQEIRKNNADIPIVLISSYTETADLIAACSLRLVDYVQKPMDFKGLIDILYRSMYQLVESGMLIKHINSSVSYDLLAKSLIVDKALIPLTRNEIAALELLLSRRGKLITYDTFYAVLEGDMSDGALKNLILRIRKKIGGNGNIRNLSKIGYTLI
jgi:DNA-binding response OmpR family regulator